MDIPIRELIDAISVQLQTHAEELTDLDRAIGDGDHGINMARGWNAVVAARALLIEASAACSQQGSMLFCTGS